MVIRGIRMFGKSNFYYHENFRGSGLPAAIALVATTRPVLRLSKWALPQNKYFQFLIGNVY